MNKTIIAPLFFVAIICLAIPPLWLYFLGGFYKDCHYVEQNHQNLDAEELGAIFSKYINDSQYKIVTGANLGLVGPNEGIFIYHSHPFLPDQKCEVYIEGGKITKVIVDMGI